MTKQVLSKSERREERMGYLFILPWIIGFLAFAAFPIAASLLLSFTKWDIYKAPSWVGLSNFQRLFQDELFYKSMKVTLTYSAFSIPLSLVLGLGLSLLLNLKIKGIDFYRTLFYLPSVITGVAISMVWMWIFNDGYGLLNYLLSLIGIEGPHWFKDPNWVLPAYVIMSLWGVGGSAIMFLGGLQNIPGHLYEAAKIDGASVFQRFYKVTLPLLTPTLFFLLLMGIIGSFQVFTIAYIMNGRGAGGPDNAGLFYMLYLYQKAFKSFDMGYASAMAWVGGLISLVLALIVYRTQNKWVYYEAGDTGKGEKA
ncbi:MAG: transporter permease [Cohnella sp.]|nr:transporter permease [Cohnella sp.]